MATKPTGVLGTATNPGSGQPRQTVGHGNFQQPAVPHSTTLADLERRATALAHSVANSVGWNQTQGLAYKLVGQQSFTAGVVVGMGENLVKTVVAAVGLIQTLALAEYWESKHDQSFLAHLQSSVFFAIAPGVGLSLALVDRVWPGFDHKAQEAFEERAAMVDAVKHAFTHPKEFLGTLTKGQEAKARQFIDLVKQQSLSGNFHAGVLMGELLFDLLMVIDLAVGLAKLALAVPKLARYAEDVARLAREFRAARQLEKTATELAEPGPRITPAQKTAGASGTPATPATGPGSLAHKAARWQEYQDRGGDWPYSRWSNVYDSNMKQASLANDAVDAYHDTLGWGEREVTLDANVDGVDYPRRLDIADVATSRGIEYKTGYQTATQDNLWEIARDKALQDDSGWDIKWVFRDSASQPLQDALTNAGIKFTVGN